MEQLVELLKQIQELAGVAIDALEGAAKGAGGGEKPPGGGEKPPGGGEGGPPPGGPEGGPPPEKEMPPGR